FEGTVDFDPGAGTFNLTSFGGGDVFIMKLNANGDLVWARQVGGTEEEQGLAIAADNDGNVFTTGYFYVAACDFDPGPGTVSLTPISQSDAFVLKLDADGDFAWVKQIGGNQADRGNTIEVDGSGNVVISGGYYGYPGTVDLDPGPGFFNVTQVGSIAHW